jgi:hypothetical protein
VLAAGVLSLTATEDTPLTISKADLLAGAADVESPVADLAITVGALTPAGAGKLVANADGSYTFTPAANSVQGATFNYTVTDGGDGDDVPKTSSPRSVAIAISERMRTAAPSTPAQPQPALLLLPAARH